MTSPLTRDLLGHGHLPLEHVDRVGRIALLVQAADALVAGQPVPPRAARLLGQALQVWLSEGGDLDRHLGLRAPRGSHLTASVLAQRLATDDLAATGSPAEVRAVVAEAFIGDEGRPIEKDG